MKHGRFKVLKDQDLETTFTFKPSLDVGSRCSLDQEGRPHSTAGLSICRSGRRGQSRLGRQVELQRQQPRIQIDH